MCCSYFTSDFCLYAIYTSYPRVLLAAESKENIYSEYVDFGVEIIVKNYKIFLVVFLFIGYCYNFFLII